MIVFLTFLFAIGLFLAVMFSHQKWLMAVMGLLFVLCTTVTTLNYSQHYGMEKQTSSKVQKIYPATGKLPIILYQPVGTSGRDDVYIYKTRPNQTKPLHTQANELTHNQVKYTNQTQARLVTKETRWHFKNSFYRYLFMGAGLDGKLVSRHNTLYYPKGYMKVSVKQMKKLQAAMANQAAPQTGANQSPEMQAAMIKQALANLK